MARKNAKTATIACILLAHVAGPEAKLNSQIVSGAMSRDQAALVFNLAAKMVQLSPELSRLVRVVPSGKRLIGLAKNVEYKALAADGSTAHGLSPVLAILDEVGQVKGPQSDFVDAITTAQGAHEHPLLIAISTQAANPGDLFSIWLDDAAASKDPRIVCHLYAAPEDCALDDESAWLAANPALDLFRSRDDLAEQAITATRMFSAQNTFRLLCLNQRINISSPLIGPDAWKPRAGDAEWIPRERVYLALDLSAKTDLTALVGVSAEDGSRVQAWFWKPAASLIDHERRDRVPYSQWVEQGYIDAVDGRAIHPRAVAMKVAELNSEFEVVGLAYDRWQIDNVLREFDEIGLRAYQDGENGDGLRIVAWGQGYKDFSPAIDALETSILTNDLVHPNNPVLSWNVANAVATMDPAGGRKLDKVKARFRIDGAVALAMALGLKARERVSDEVSVYETRGLLVF